MSLVPNSIGPNPQQPGIAAELFVPDQLIAGALKLVTAVIILAAGTLARGTVLGRITAAASVIVTAGATNAGNGTVGSITQGNTFGIFTLLFTDATHGTVTDPNGVSLGTFTAGSAFTNAEITFTFTAGGTPMAAGDTFTLNSVQSAGQYIKSVATANDGSQTPTALLVDAADASAGPVKAGAYLMGEFNINAMIYDASWTPITLTNAMRPYGIFVKNVVNALDPS